MTSGLTFTLGVMLYLEDCLEGMKKLEDGSIDAIVTSPPYNLDIKYGSYADNKPRQEYLDWLVSIFREGKRVLNDDGEGKAGAEGQGQGIRNSDVNGCPCCWVPSP